ncbi:MAG: hypothetical protein ACI9T8_000133 [Candidatus Saccharimonadales bacterium]|jgi:hypothetical protein
MLDLIERYISPDFNYVMENGPRVIRNRKDALLQGLNCVALMHLAIDDLFGVKLPPALDCYELFLDDKYTERVRIGEIAHGDLVWFGPTETSHTIKEFSPNYGACGIELLNWGDHPVNHVGICVGTEETGPQILHASQNEQTNAVWALSEFANHERYVHLYGVDRIIAT